MAAEQTPRWPSFFRQAWLYKIFAQEGYTPFKYKGLPLKENFALEACPFLLEKLGSSYAPVRMRQG
jgi:hypothetical protein